MQPRLGHMKHSFSIDEGGRKEFICPPMKRFSTSAAPFLSISTIPAECMIKIRNLLPVWTNRAKAGSEVAAATATHESMQWNSDMGAPGTRRCSDDYTREIPMDSRIAEGLGWQWQRDATRAATAASTLQELGFWVRATEPFKVRQVQKQKLLKSSIGEEKRVIKRRYLSLVLTAFAH